jgi:non-ribosomal peptide synthase protein (TIGR01720 family)
MSESQMIITSGSGRHAEVASILTSTFAKLLGRDSGQVKDSVNFLEMGADSLFLLQFSQAISTRFGVKIPFRMMLEEHSTITALAAYLDSSLPPDELVSSQLPEPHFSGNGALPSPAPAPDILPAASGESGETLKMEEEPLAPRSALEGLLTQQLQIMAQQLEALRQSKSSNQAWTSIVPSVAPKPDHVATAVPLAPSPDRQTVEKVSSDELGASPIAFYEPIKTPASRLDPQQQIHVSELGARLGKRTKRSKQIAQDYRPFLADDRATAKFSLLWKEMQYPLIVERAAGSRIWDVDGNEYVDLTMGFGALLFGHSPSFVIEAAQEQIKRGLGLGTESILARQSAELICKLTGVERVAFCNSGTEAVMIALRLARLVTGRTKVALFEGCFHGTFDGVLVRPDRSSGGKYNAAPMAPGVPRHMVENVIMAKIDDQESLDYLRAHAHELAAVLVEPQPSRMPGARVEEFLRELRILTEQSGAALIFDEVFTGFRFHIGGAQALYGVKADIVTYGKAIGGGMPVAAIAGKAVYLNSIDGGMWNYGDSSYPQAATTYSVGTYFKHPFIMASVWAAINYLKDNSPHIYERLDQMTARLTDALNAHFKANRMPVRVVRFGSLFRFFFGPGVKYPDLFYFNLLDKGVYVSETRGCLLSTAHTEADIDHIAKAVKETVAEMRAAGLLPPALSRANDGAGRQVEELGEPDPSADAADRSMGSFVEPEALPLQTIAGLAAVAGSSAGGYEEQGEITGSVCLTPIHHWFFEQKLPEPHHYNLSNYFEIARRVDPTLMERAVAQLLAYHDALRLRVAPSETGDRLMIVGADGNAPFCNVDLSSLSDAEQKSAREAKAGELQASLDLYKGPLIRVALFDHGPGKPSKVLIIVHHLAVDIVSWPILIRTLLTTYHQLRQGKPVKLPVKTTPFKKWAERLQEYAQSQQQREELTYWLSKPWRRVGRLPVDYVGGDNSEASIGTVTMSLSVEETAALLYKAPKVYRTQVHEPLLSALAQAFERWTGNSSLLVAVEGHGREGIFEDIDLSRTVGWFTAIFPLLLDLEHARNGEDALRLVKEQIRSVPNGGIGYGLLRYMNADGEIRKKMRGLPEAEVCFNYAGQFGRILPTASLPNEEQESEGAPRSPLGKRPFLIEVSVIITSGALRVEWQYSENAHRRSTIESLTAWYMEALQSLIRQRLSGEALNYTTSDFSFAKQGGQ